MRDAGAGTVYARLLTKDDPGADQRLATEAAVSFAKRGLELRVEFPAVRGGMGAGGGSPIDAWIYVVVPLGAAAGAGVLAGALGAIGADFWKALVSSIKHLRASRRPASRSILLLTLRAQSGVELIVFLHPDDPLTAVDILARKGFVPPTQDFKSVELSWDQSSGTWTVAIVETPTN